MCVICVGSWVLDQQEGISSPTLALSYSGQQTFFARLHGAAAFNSHFDQDPE